MPRGFHWVCRKFQVVLKRFSESWSLLKLGRQLPMQLSYVLQSTAPQLKVLEQQQWTLRYQSFTRVFPLLIAPTLGS